jgi:hypothetical protein
LNGWKLISALAGAGGLLILLGLKGGIGCNLGRGETIFVKSRVII